MDLSSIKIGENPPHEVNVVIEIPQGGVPVKYEVDKKSGAMFVDRFLHTAMFYPANYGFIPHTLSLRGSHGAQRHSITEVSQLSTGLSSQSLPTRRQPGDGVTCMRKGTLGSIGGAGVPPIPTIQALVIARSRLLRALCTSWSKMVVA